MPGDNEDDLPGEYPMAEYVATDSRRTRTYRTPPQGISTRGVVDPIGPVTTLDLLDQRVEQVERLAESLDASRRFWRWVAGIGIPALISAGFVLLLYTADKISASAERVGEQRAEIRALQDEVHNLRLRIDKLAGVDSKAMTIVKIP